MPMPMPHNEEEHDAFMERCMSEAMMNGDFPEGEQRRGVCERQWNDGRGMHVGSECRMSIGECRMALRSADFATQAETIEVRIVPAGMVRSTKGDFTVDGESFAAMAKAFGEHATFLPIDYEHQTLGGDYASPDGTSPAAGWIKKLLRYEEGKGIFASVAWTERARNMIRSGEYLYLSPVVVVRKSDRKVVGLHSAALTNKPAIVGMERVAAKDDGMDKLAAGQRTLTKETETMELLKQMQDLIGGPTDTAEMLVNKVGELKKKAEGAGTAPATVKAVCEAAGLKADATAEALVCAVTKLKGEAGKSDELAGRLAKIESSQAQERAQKKIDALVSAHKLNPNDKPEYEAAMKLAASDPATLDALYANKKPLVEPGRTTPAEGGTGGGDKSRESIITNSAKKFREDASLGKLTTCKDFVSLALQDAGQARLSEEEAKKVSA